MVRGTFWPKLVAHFEPFYPPETKKLDYFIAINSEKSEVQIDFMNNQYLFLDFSMPGCKGCVKGIPKVIEFSKRYKNKLDVVILDSYTNHNNWMKIYEQLHTANLPLQLLLDEYGVVSKAFDVSVFPTYMLFDEKGLLIKKWVGRPPRDIDKYIDRQ